MQYQEFIQRARELDFIEDDTTADAAVKAVLGIMATTLDQTHAQRVAQALPEPLSLWRLRGHQQREHTIPLNEAIDVVAGQFRFSHEESDQLFHEIIACTREALPEEIVLEAQQNLPEDWRELLH